MLAAQEASAAENEDGRILECGGGGNCWLYVFCYQYYGRMDNQTAAEVCCAIVNYMEADADGFWSEMLGGCGSGSGCGRHARSCLGTKWLLIWVFSVYPENSLDTL